MRVTGCDTDEPLQVFGKPETELIPIASGNFWIYNHWQIEPTWRDTVRNDELPIRDVIIEDNKIRACGTHRYSNGCRDLGRAFAADFNLQLDG